MKRGKKIKVIMSVILITSLLIIPILGNKASALDSDFVFDVSTKTVTGYTGSAEEIIIPEQIGGIAVEGIGAGAFQNNKKIKKVRLSESLKTIESNAFNGCTSVKEVVFPKLMGNIKKIGENAFGDSNSYKSAAAFISVPNINTIVIENNALMGLDVQLLVMCTDIMDQIDETVSKFGLSNYAMSVYKGVVKPTGVVTRWLTENELNKLSDGESVDLYQNMKVDEWAIYESWNLPERPGDMLPLFIKNGQPVNLVGGAYTGYSNYSEAFQVSYSNEIQDKQKIQIYLEMQYYGNQGQLLPVTATVVNGRLSYNDQRLPFDIFMDSGEYMAFLTPNLVKEIKVNMPNKTKYYEGEAFDPDGLSVTLNGKLSSCTYDYTAIPKYIYTDGIDLSFDNNNWQMNLNALKAGSYDIEYRVTIRDAFGEGLILETYGGGEIEQGVIRIPITVEPVVTESLEIENAPTKAEYFEGETFDPTGLSLQVIKNNGQKQLVTYSSSNKNEFQFSVDELSVDDKQVIITYDGKTVEQAIKVDPILISKLSIKNPPIIQYYEGDNFNPEGLELTIHKNNGTTEDIIYSKDNQEHFNFSLSQLKPEDKVIVITYQGKTVDQEISVQPLLLESIEIKQSPTLIEYLEEESFDPTGLILTVSYNNGKVEDITYSEETKNLFAFSKDFLSIDDKEVDIKYNNKIIKQSINVNPRYTKNKVEEGYVKITGNFEENTVLSIQEIEKYNEVFGGLINKDILGSYEVKLIGKYRGELSLTFEVGEENNGKRANILHKFKDGKIERFQEEVKEGKVTVKVKELSPFLIYIDSDIKEGIIPPLEIPIPEISQELPKETLVETGDKQGMSLYILMLGGSLIVLGDRLVRRKRKNK